MMVGGVGMGEQVKTDAEVAQRREETLVIMGKQLDGRDARGLGSQGNRRPVRVRTRNNQHIIATQPFEAGKDISGQEATSQMASM